MSKIIKWMKAHKLWTGAVLVVLLIAIVANGGQKQKTATTKPVETPKTTQAVKPATPEISYKTVEDKGTNQAIVVSTANVNAADLKQLGEQLKAANSSKPFIRVYVFDDATAASYLDAELQGQSTDAQNAVYDPHFVAIYQKNQSTKLNRFVITLKGDQDPNPQTINY